MKTGDEMKKKEAALSIVVGAIADIKLFEGEPSLLSEAYATTKAKIEQPHISDRASFFYHLIMLRLREEMMSDTIALKTEGIQQEKEEDLLHGEAVASGLYYSIKLSEKLLGFPERKANQIYDFIEKYYKIIPLKENLESILNYLSSDKKNIDNEFCFVLLKNP